MTAWEVVYALAVASLVLALVVRGGRDPRHLALASSLTWLVVVDVARELTGAHLDAVGVEAPTFRSVLHVDQTLYLSTTAVFGWMAGYVFRQRWLPYASFGVFLLTIVALLVVYPIPGHTKAALYAGYGLVITVLCWVAVIRTAASADGPAPDLVHLSVMILLGLDSIVFALAFLDQLGGGLTAVAASWQAVVAANIAALSLCAAVHALRLRPRRPLV